MTPQPDRYLLLLQDFRHATDDFFTPLFEGISALAVSPAIIILAAVLYWTWNKHGGMWFFFGYSAIQYVNAVIKLTCCIYRPWIYCPGLTPAGRSMETALGYSFPSGHSSSAAAIYGTPLFALHKTRPVSAILLGVMILLTMFSRNYLGVHTLQDVLVGASVSLVIVIMIKRLIVWVDNGSNRDVIAAVCAMCLIIAAMIYFLVKPYPMDYIDGELLVDPVKMQATAFMGLGFLTGFIIGWLIERRFVGFDNSGTLLRKSLCSVVGIVIFALIYMLLHKVILRPLSANWRHYIEMTSIMLYIVGLWPIAIKKFVNEKD